MYIICINTNVEKEMKKLLDLGFKKVPTEDGFVMYELNPAALRKSQVTSDKPQAASGKQPVTIRKRLDKSR
jgi:hypothetical protein